MKRKLIVAGVVVLVAAAGVAAPQKAHQHGAAALDVGVEPKRVTLLLDLPQDSVLGFEREPRSDAERAAAAEALARLNDPAALFRIDPAAQCTPERTRVDAPRLAATAAETRAADAHEDISASYDFACQDGHRAGFVETLLFERFPRLQRIDVQAVTRRGQVKATLKRPVSRLPLAR
jgi:hypothetical protein